jgi:hypothetical protein
MGHEKPHFDLNSEYYKFEGRMKTISITFIVLGIIGAAWAFFGYEANKHSRFWSNFLLNTYYFNGMAITAIFFVSAHTIGYGGWFASLKRIFESFGSFVIISVIFFLIIIAGLWFDWHNLYHHWTHAPASDTIVGDKIAFLNKNMFTSLSVAFFALWLIGIRMIRKHSLSSDMLTDEYAYNQRSKYIAAFYIVVFGVSSSVFSWMAVMSLDPHWYSTLFGWYNFASYMCGFLCMSLIVVLYLKYKGLLNFVNDSHIHNIVLFLFGFSVFWTYLWFSQYMLIWYGNIPEDTMYFYKRFEIPLFKILFFVALILNFFFMFLFLIKRSAKRNPWVYGIAAGIILFGHYLDFYSMVMFEPNAPMHHEEAISDKSHHSSAATNSNKLLAENHEVSKASDSVHAISNLVKEEESAVHADVPAHEASHNAVDHNSSAHDTPHNMASIGLIEIFMFLGFIGLFLFSVLSSLSKDRLVPLKSPFLDESLNYKW